MKSKYVNHRKFICNLPVFLMLSILAPLAVLAMDDDSKEERKHAALMLKIYGEEVIQHKAKLRDALETAYQDEAVQDLFNAYMQKAAYHYQLGERDNQLSCYQEILNIPGLSNGNVARTHTNIAVIHFQLGRTLLAAAHLKKAESIAPVEDIEKTMGEKTVGLFSKVYYKASQLLYSSAPQQALPYLERVLQFPEQYENFYVHVHLQMTVLYDSLLKFNDSLSHALQVLKSESLTPENRDRALCYAATGSKEINKPEDCFRYYEQIRNLNKLASTEQYLVLAAVGSSCFTKGNQEQGLRYGCQALEALDPHSPQYLLTKHELATAYGENGNKQKEMELYAEILGAIKVNCFEPSWQPHIQSIQTSIETAFFVREMKKFEKRLKEDLHQKFQEQRANREEEKIKKRKEKEQRKEKNHQKLIEEIKAVQREAVAREKQLEQEKLQRLENEKRRAEERKKRVNSVEKSPNEPSEYLSLSEPVTQITEKVKSKVKTRGTAVLPETHETAIQETSNSVSMLPVLGTRAQVVFDQIEGEDWNFSREDYTHYLEDFQCVRRDSGSSHRIFQLPKTTRITLKKDAQEIQEEIFLADEDVKLGSVTLPAWKEKTIPFYLRKQIRSLHEKIIKIYTKITHVRDATESNSTRRRDTANGEGNKTLPPPSKV